MGICVDTLHVQQNHGLLTGPSEVTDIDYPRKKRQKGENTMVIPHVPIFW